MFNKIIANILPYFPKKFVWIFSKRYVAGVTIDECISISKQLNEKGIEITVDLLGEFIHTIEEAESNKSRYIEIINRFTDEKIIGNFSVKPTSFGLLIDKDKCYELLKEVVTKASERNSFVRIDMEDSQCTSDEIELYKKLQNDFPYNVGLVLQAYLYRTRRDIEDLIKDTIGYPEKLNFRLCKGIYVEPENIAYQGYSEVRTNYLNLLELLLKNGIYTGIATHDSYLVEESLKLINKYSEGKDKYEFQMLYGVTPNLRDRLISEGHKMRVYVPFGKDWFGYCSRRLKENPKMVWDIIKAIFVRQ
jgi:proline dehydrogenase